MKSIQEKVKDLIEVCEYESIQDFDAEPAKTLASYHFTSITSELMSQWIDSVTKVSDGIGIAKALAGFRGVGKSHFLATFGALLANPELRSRVTESHVATSTQHLQRKHYPVASVKRGTKETLLEEIKIGIASALDINLAELPDTAAGILGVITEAVKDIPFVMIVDTAFERNARVVRDDGVLLGEFAEIAKDLNVFIAIALDDDITEADGINAAIARVYTIDYLDQTHLNKIVNTHIFPKQRRTATQLHDTYLYFRKVIPGFRWSEERFSSLYPLHPSVLELAPFIRLYSKHFALLGFASEAGVRILGRPANSLIALDEVFDNVEASLRKSIDLAEAFEIYDKIGQDVVAKIPVMQRLQAKLILKALFILSLDGDGTTAKEISATMMIYDEKDPQKAIQTVEELLETAASVFPDEIQRKNTEGAETRFSLKVSGKDRLNEALDEAIKDISHDVIPAMLRRVAKETFTDWNLPVGKNEYRVAWTDCQVTWRGSQRRCRLYWNWENECGEMKQKADNPDFLDLELFVNNPQNSTVENQDDSVLPRAFWQTSELKDEEIATILRYYVLLNNEGLRTEFAEQVRAAGHTHTIAVEKIWERIFLKEGVLLLNGEEYSFAVNKLERLTIGELLTPTLEHLFGRIYPKHPHFAEPLGMNEVSQLVNDLFSGARKTHQGVQTLAEVYGLPLGLVCKNGDEYALETEDNLLKLPLIEKILYQVGQSENSTVSLKTVYKLLKQKPFGLIREAQQLILAALVAQRKIEFVTTNNDRINRRSLDLKIIWDDIVAIAKPANVQYNSIRLLGWAKLLTKVADIESIDIAKDRKLVKEALNKWLEVWDDGNAIEQFNDLPDEVLNTRIWYLSVNIEKSFGSVANSVRSFCDDSISLEACLQRIGDSFSDSKEEFTARETDLSAIKSFNETARTRQQIWGYLAICEKTQDDDIEGLRSKLLFLTDQSKALPTVETNRELDQTWSQFQELYSEHFALSHDTVMKSHQIQESFDVIIKSDQWWEFQNLSKLPVFHQKHWKETQKLIRRFKELDCDFDVREILKSNPSCACSFTLTQMQDWEDLPKLLIKTIESGRKSYRRTFSVLSETLVQLVESYLRDETDETFANTAKELLKLLKDKTEIELLSTNQMIILDKVFSTAASSQTVNIAFPHTTSLMTSEELRQNMNTWIDELPTEPLFLKL